jgi:hypothetical protein
MKLGYLEYPLANGYIHNWLVAGPQAVEVTELERFTGPKWKTQIVKHYYQPESGVKNRPAESAKCKLGDFKGEWRYIRTRDDHFVDISAFYHLTHYLRAWAYAEVNSPVEQDLEMILTTNGPADLWINDQHVHRQEHFFHQIPNRVKLTAHLIKGVNCLLVRIEEVAARECPYTMALQLIGFQTAKGKEDKVVRIPTTAPNPFRRLQLELLFEASYLQQDVYGRDEEVVVHLPEGPAGSTSFNIRVQNADEQIYADAMRQGQTDLMVPLLHPYELPEGSYQITMLPPPQEYYEGGIRITRAYECYTASNKYSTQPYGTYEERRGEALLDAARRGTNVFSEIAKMELGYWGSVEQKVILDAIDGINRRKDCSDFYLCGLLGMVYRYGETPEFPDALKQPLEDCILNFKYWDDEPGSDAMCYRTENHSLLFHTCEVLAGQLYPEQIFSNANQTGRWHIEKGERLALAWLNDRAATGFKEWDSNTYFEEDTLSLSTLASLAENRQVWEMAAVVLDKMFFTMAVNSFKGVFGSTHGRTYTPMIKTGYRECTSGISRLLWGMGIFNDRILGTVSLACSSYDLPPIIAAIAADQPADLWSREQHVGDEESYRNSGSIGTGVNKVTYKTPDYMLCSAQDWHPGEKGYQQHIWQATLSPMATIFTTHPPCAAEDGSHRPNFWHGNETLPRVAQWKDVLLAVYNFPTDDWMGFTHAYFPAHAFDNYDVRDNWAFGRVGDGYIALSAMRGIELQERGDNAYRELRSPGTPNLWICQMGRKDQDGSFEAFIQSVLDMPVKFGENEVELTSLRGEKLRFGWQGPLLVNGNLQELSGFDHYDSPYCTSKLGDTMMEIRYGEEAMRLHFDAQPPSEKSES